MKNIQLYSPYNQNKFFCGIRLNLSKIKIVLIESKLFSDITNMCNHYTFSVTVKIILYSNYIFVCLSLFLLLYCLLQCVFVTSALLMFWLISTIQDDYSLTPTNHREVYKRGGKSRLEVVESIPKEERTSEDWDIYCREWSKVI